MEIMRKTEEMPSLHVFCSFQLVLAIIVPFLINKTKKNNWVMSQTVDSVGRLLVEKVTADDQSIFSIPYVIID